MRIIAVCMIITLGAMRAADAALASTEYVNSVKSDWNQSNANLPDYIKNKPDIITTLDNNNQAFSDTTIANANAVTDGLDTKADKNDSRFDTIPSAMPTITPDDGRVLIWVE